MCFTTVLCACSEKSQRYINVAGDDILICHNDEELNLEILSDEQTIKIYDLVKLPLSTGEKSTGYINEIRNIAPFKEVKKFVSDNSTYYYNIFKHKDSNLLLIYDNEYFICGCIYYNKPIDSEKLKEAKTFGEVQKLDITLTDNEVGLNELSCYVLFSRRGYQSNYNADALSSTLHFTNDGLYLLAYDNTIYSKNSSKIKISSIEKVDDGVFNKVYDLVYNTNK